MADLRQIRGPGGQFASGRGVAWVGLEILAKNINNRGKTLNTTRKLAARRLSGEMLAYMHENAPWQDVTGDARERLQADVIHDDSQETSTIALAHGVDYGLWLEVGRSGEFAIIVPTILAYQDRVMGTIKEMDDVGQIIGSL